jgi:hypothetical protein
MSVKRFKFVSPGIFINEVDNSQLPQAPEEVGPVIIGRSLRGPGMRPVRVDSFSEFVELFGEPVAGLTGEDVWRQGHILGPTYAAYAAQAYLKSGGPVTFVRLLGEQHPDHTAGGKQAGWSVPSAVNTSTATGPGAYGLFISNGGSDSVDNARAIFEVKTLAITSAAITTADFGSGNETLGAHFEFATLAAAATGANTYHVTEAVKHHAAVGVHIVSFGDLASDTLTLAWEGPLGAQTKLLSYGGNWAAAGDADAAATTLKTAINDADDLPFFAITGLELFEIGLGNWFEHDGSDKSINAAWNDGDNVIIFAAYPGLVTTADGMVVTYAGDGGGAGPLGSAMPSANDDTNFRIDTHGICGGTPTASATQIWWMAPAAKGFPAVQVAGVDYAARPAPTAAGLRSEVRQNIVDAINNSQTNAYVWGHATFAARASGIVDSTVGQYTVKWLGDAGPDAGGAAAGVFTEDGAADIAFTGVETGLGGASGMGATTNAIVNIDPDTILGGSAYDINAFFSQATTDDPLTGQHGVLAAVLYSAQGGLHLAGTNIDGTAIVGTAAGLQTGVSQWIKSTGANNAFAISVKNGVRPAENYNVSAASETISFNFDINSKNYIRNVLNTNPTITNTGITAAGQGKGYWLGQTFDSHLAQSQKATAAAGLLPGNRLNGTPTALTTAANFQFACLVPLEQTLGSGDDVALQNGSTSAASPAQSPWIISQHQGTSTEWNTASNAMLLGDTDYRDTGIARLFKIHSLYAGEWDMKNFKVSVYDVKGPSNSFEKYGTFGVGLRKADDTDSAPQWVERYSGLNLNPASPDYIARRIGDMQTVWDDAERRYTDRGQYLSNSRYIRIEMSEDIDAGAADARYLPFGFVGPTRYNGVLVRSGRASNPTAPAVYQAPATLAVNDAAALAVTVSAHPGAARNLMLFAAQIGHSDNNGNVPVAMTGVEGVGAGDVDANMTQDAFQTVLKFPSLRLRANTQDDTLSSPKDAFFGVDTRMVGSERHDLSYADMVRRMVPARNGVDLGTSQALEYQFIFTLDDVQRVSGSTTHATWQAGQYAAGTSLTGASGAQYTTVLDAGFDSFTLPMIGGQDGMDITEVEPFRHGGGLGSGSPSDSDAMQSSSTQLTHYAFNSIKKAIDTVSDPEVVECNMMAMPGVSLAGLTQHLINVCENRADALAVVDIQDDYVPRSWSTNSESSRMPNVDNAITTLKDRGLNSSYACCYFPWVQIRDNIGSRLIWAPPSVVALGTMSSSAKRTDVWFAPAGFTRGGLTEGSAGLPVTQVRHRLSSKERDKLYEASINPIAQFPSEGIVIFGQKTLQVTQSALDRINVRRLMIYLKKNVSRFAKTVLFDQNVQTTWSRFVSKVDPFLASVKSNFGLTEYKIILDETTTTPEMIDRNIMYAKIFLKPARAIEYIAIDFVITDSGASFDD